MKRFLSLILPVGMMLSMVLAMMPSCNHQQQGVPAAQKTHADSLLNAVFETDDQIRVIEVVDSLEMTGDISKIDACFTRGQAYTVMGQYRVAEKELNRALAETPQNAYDSLYHYKSIKELVFIYGACQNYEGVLRIALPALDGIKQMLDGPYRIQTCKTLEEIYMGIGGSQINLGMMEDAAKSYEQAYEYGKQHVAEYPRYVQILSFANDLGIIKTSYEKVGDWESAGMWLDRQDAYMAEFEAYDDKPDWVCDLALAIRELSHASYAAGTNQMAEANRAYEAYNKTETARNGDIKFEAAGVLLRMKRYAEAADIYRSLDQYIEDTGLQPTLDNMVYWKGKFEANYRSGRIDSALVTADRAFDYLDSAVVGQKRNTAAEMAIIYETQQKDAEIAQQQLSLSRQRWIGTLVALLLLSTFFIIYTWYRRRAQQRLATAHEKLQEAYDQLEETTTAKERIESELRIARDIQMSMVPGVFPQREGLDMYAEMSPAKEVGGDLYGYVLRDDALYFCVGDVSGKGVPASLFMAQAARLFRTLASESIMPAEIAMRLNNALSESNDRCMFVTMFIGLLHLDTGQLDYCNCGHNPPVFDGKFLKMKYTNQPIGLFEGAPYAGESMADMRGRMLLVYTDGLNEAENNEKQLLGDDRVIELMADTQRLVAKEVISKLKAAVDKHRAGAAPNDDLTLMCLKLQ